MDITIKNLFNLDGSQYPELFEELVYPWEVVARLGQFLTPLVQDVKKAEYEGVFIGPNVIIGKDTTVEPGAVIFGPTVIGKNCTIRSGAYIRGNVVIEDNVVIGHASEIKNSIILSGAAIAHFNYVGDSIIGAKGHLAGGSIIANTKLDRSEITVKMEDEVFKTGLTKFGAAVGDNAEIGSNAVLNPGSVLGKNSAVYPLVSWRGVLPENHIAKSSAEIVERK